MLARILILRELSVDLGTPIDYRKSSKQHGQNFLALMKPLFYPERMMLNKGLYKTFSRSAC